MKCAQCGKNADTADKRLLTVDGDFACSEACEKKYIAERDRFFNQVIHDDTKMKAWWKE